MKLRKHIITFFLSLVIFIPLTLLAQSPESLLKDLEYTQFSVLITWDEKIPDINREGIQESIESMCEQELKNAGLKLSPEGLNRLYFNFLTSYREDGLVAVAYTIDMYEYIIPRKHIMYLLKEAVTYADYSQEFIKGGYEKDSLLAVNELQSQTLQNFVRMLDSENNYWWRPTWLSDLGVFTVGKDYLKESMEEKTRELLETFVSEYKEANKKE